MIDTFVLIVTNHEDVTTDFIVLELVNRDIPFFRLNTECVTQSTIRYFPDKGVDSFVFDLNGQTVCLADVTSAYYRRPGIPIPAKEVEVEAYRDYCEAEWLSALKGIYSFLGDKWLNAPFAVEAAENKPLQLAIAKRIGFLVPDTCITNDPKVIRDFRTLGPMIAKRLLVVSSG